MTDIRKYSKEWFATNGSDKQKNAIKNVSIDKIQEMRDNKALTSNILNYDSLIGKRDTARAKFYSKEITNSNSKEVELIKTFGGIDNIFDIIDENGDDVITSDELAVAAAIDTADWSTVDSINLSAQDIYKIYNNVVLSENAKVETKDNITTYDYANGSKTLIEKDANGNIVTKYSKDNLTNRQTRETLYQYKDKVKTEYIYDSKGRVISEEKDCPGSLNDYVVKTEYKKDKTIKTRTTIGRTEVKKYDLDNNIIRHHKKFNYEIDGEIGNTKQMSIGNCWLLSQVNALSYTEIGKTILNDSIHPNSDGTVTVELKGLGKYYTYTPERVCSNDYGDLTKGYSSGDMDMKVLELAFSDYRQEQMEKNSSYANKYIPKKTPKDDPLKSGYREEAIFGITGLKTSNVTNKDKIEKQLNNKKDNPEKYAMVTGFKEKDFSFGIHNGNNEPFVTTSHQYSIKRVTDDKVVVINPWDTSKEIEYPLDKFLENCNGISYVDLSKYKK